MIYTPQPVFDVRDYGAVGDGFVDDSDALRRAIAACEAAGGGILYVPPGHYRVPPKPKKRRGKR